MARSDRPLPPRVSTSPQDVALDSLPHGEWDNAALGGTLAADFDEPLLLTHARMERATLVGAALAGSRLVDVVIDGCDLSGADLDSAALTRVEARNSKLAGVQLVQSRWHDVRFIDCQLDGANPVGPRRVRTVRAMPHAASRTPRLRHASLATHRLPRR